jgi:L-ascorbate metabolism protein UlaG (beta-lactamase superfamily)
MSRIRFLGHATTLIEANGVRIMTDPLLRPRVRGLVHRHSNVLSPTPGLVDAVLISHLHHDHLDVRSLHLLGEQTLVVTPRRGRDLLGRAGFRNVLEVQPGQRFDVAGLPVSTTRAVHIGMRAPLGPWGGTVGYVIEAERRVYFAGDTQAFAEMGSLGPIEVALMPIGGWGPILGPGHMGPAAAVEALRLIRPRVAIPVHFGSLVPVGFHRRTWSYLTRPPLAFVDLMSRELPEVQVRVLEPGQWFDL